AFVAVTTADARLFHPAHRRIHRDLRGGVAFVDVDRAALDTTGDIASQLFVLGPDARVQPVFRVVGAFDGFIDALDAVDAHDRSESLLAGRQGVLGHVGQHRWLVEIWPEVGSSAPAGEHRRAVRAGVLDVLFDRFEL